MPTAKKQPAGKLAMIPLGQIVVGERARKTLRGIDTLAASIERLGLLCPIAVRPDMTLVAGHRRLEAFKLLGRTEIPCHIITTLDDASALLEAERDENIERDALTTEEKVLLGLRLEDVEKQASKTRQKELGRTHGKTPCDKLSQGSTGTSRAKVGAAIGMSGTTWERAKAVWLSGDKALVGQMLESGKVMPAYRLWKARAGQGQPPKPRKAAKARKGTPRGCKEDGGRLCQRLDDIADILRECRALVPTKAQRYSMTLLTAPLVTYMRELDARMTH